LRSHAFAALLLAAAAASALMPRRLASQVESARDKGLRAVGFTARSHSGVGEFVSEEQIAEQKAVQMTDLFTKIHGVRVDYSSGYPMIAASTTPAGGCVSYIVDGDQVRISDPADFNKSLQPGDVSAIEVYTAPETPDQFRSPSVSQCEVIVIWTKKKIGG
jgi:hypothetical protein